MYVNARAPIERLTDTGVELLIQTRNKPEEAETCLELPGGRVEEYESLIAAMRREVLEETGLELTQIQGIESKVETGYQGSNVECLQPFAVYQTTRGPVDSMGAYFLCKQGPRRSIGIWGWHSEHSMGICPRIGTGTS